MEKETTIKEVIKNLEKDFRYVRIIKLNNKMILDSDQYKINFKRFILASNSLEQYSTSQEEVNNLKIKANLSHVELRIKDILKSEKINIPIFEFVGTK